jgi:hypothetical protein
MESVGEDFIPCMTISYYWGKDSEAADVALLLEQTIALIRLVRLCTAC